MTCVQRTWRSSIRSCQVDVLGQPGDSQVVKAAARKCEAHLAVAAQLDEAHVRKPVGALLLHPGLRQGGRRRQTARLGRWRLGMLVDAAA